MSSACRFADEWVQPSVIASGKTTTCAPEAAASPIRSIARRKFSSLRPPSTSIWTRANLNEWVGNEPIESPYRSKRQDFICTLQCAPESRVGSQGAFKKVSDTGQGRLVPEKDRRLTKRGNEAVPALFLKATCLALETQVALLRE